MTRKEVFFYGAVGGVLPILANMLTIDFAPIIDHPDLLTLGNYIGYGIRVVGLVIAGGIVALVNGDVRQPLALVQLGIVAPALVTSYINGVSAAPRSPTRQAHFSIVSTANAEEIISYPRIRLAGGFSDIIRDIGPALGTRLDTLSAANRSVGSFCVTGQGKALMPGPAAKIGSQCSVTTPAGAVSGLVTN